MKSCVVGIGAMGLEMALHIQNKGMTLSALISIQSKSLRQKNGI